MKILSRRSALSKSTLQAGPQPSTADRLSQDTYEPNGASGGTGRALGAFLFGGLVLGLAASRGGAPGRAATALLGAPLGVIASDPLSIPFNALGAGDGVKRPRLLIGGLIGAAVGAFHGTCSLLGGVGLGLASGLGALTTYQAVAQMGFDPH